MVKQSSPPTTDEIRTLLGDQETERWTQEKVASWLEEKGWGRFAPTFEKYGICHERFFQITLAELVQYLPRTMTTYYERRRLLNEIRALVPSSKPIPSTPANISINTNIHDYNDKISSSSSPYSATQTSSLSPLRDYHSDITLHPRDSGIGYFSHYSAGSSSPSPSPSPSSDYLSPFARPTSLSTSQLPSNNNTTSSSSSSSLKQHHSPTHRYSPRAAFHKFKNTFRSHHTPTTINTSNLGPSISTQNSASSVNGQVSSPRHARHNESSESSPPTPPAIPARVSSTPEKISKFWATYAQHWHNNPRKQQASSSPEPPPIRLRMNSPRKSQEQKIQITSDTDTWYSLNVTQMRDPVLIKHQILKRMSLQGDIQDYQYFHENGPDPETPMDPQELMYLCSIADHSASHRILVKPLKSSSDYSLHVTATPELGKSPSDIQNMPYRPLCRKTARRPYIERSVGIQLSDPPTLTTFEQQHEDNQRLRQGSEPFIHQSQQQQQEKSWRRSEPLEEKNKSLDLWAVAPQHHHQQQQQQQHQQQQNASEQLWAVAPPLIQENGVDKKIIATTTANEERPGMDSPITKPVSNARNNNEFWGERPPAEVVFENMERYFDSKDLDKEVQVTTKRLTHTKSIRLVAREASRKYNIQRKVSAKNGGMLRRKSTKLWGQKVVEVKSRSANVMSRLPSVREHMSLSSSPTPNDDAVQWIRGKLIGKGSFGRVYLAFNVGTGEVIAVKQVEIPKTASDLLDEHQHDMVEALYQEIMMLRDLDHENIVQYLGYGHDEAESVINIFLEYVSGGSIASRVALHGAFDERLAKYFARQINILHRDIKAANILVEVDGICKISDFGLSKKNDYDEVYDQNSRMSLRGSVYWMAPEVVKNEPYSAKVDIWSLGCTLIEMLTGQRPWLSLNQIAALYNLGRHNSPTIPDNISDCAKHFLSQCFMIDPTKRPTANELLTHEFLTEDPTFDFKDYVDRGKI
ncbi:hypothetical protein K501DRAFT_285104, partial [Backusella circina FSU 941]